MAPAAGKLYLACPGQFTSPAACSSQRGLSMRASHVRELADAVVWL